MQQEKHPQCPNPVLDLVDRFHHHSDTYKDQAYNETQTRREFIDPFFAQLGWDIDNKQGYAETYKEVIHEDAIKIGGVTKAPPESTGRRKPDDSKSWTNSHNNWYIDWGQVTADPTQAYKIV